jgi:hypothetical protein
MAHRWQTHVKNILAGLLATILSVIVLAVVLAAVLLRSKRDISIGPLYLVIPLAAFAAGYYWSFRRSSRPKAPARPSSIFSIVTKSFGVGIAAMLVAEIGYIIWIWSRIPRRPHAFVAIDPVRLSWAHWLALLVSFLAGFALAFWRAFKRRLRLTSGLAP